MARLLHVVLVLVALHYTVAGVTKISQNNFIKELKDFIKNNKKAVIFFKRTYCPPCKKMAPAFQSVARSGKYRMFKFAVTTQFFSGRGYNVKSYPTIIFFINGREVKRDVGGYNKVSDNKDRMIRSLNKLKRKYKN